MVVPFTQNHITYQAQERIRKLVAPLTKLANVHYFCYRVQYSDNTFFSLITHLDYFESWFTHQFPLCGYCCKNGWHQWDPHLPKVDISKELGIGHGICHINHHEDKTEIFSFATKPENDRIYDFYLNEQNLLKKFTSHFTRAAQDIILEADTHRIAPLQETMGRNKVHHPDLDHSCDRTIDKFYYDINQPFSMLSERESQCFHFLIQGYSIQEISKMLSLAPTTIDVYIARLKSKLKCSTKKELVQLAIQSGLIEYYFQD
ncbi:MAG: response regulator transcription factor [Gammaproteobacteria bacterium]|nr:response regulator transcription factor [Gammaproteobacteria bacterium]